MNVLYVKFKNISFIRRCLINLFLGALSVLSLEPFGFFYILFITLPLFLLNSTSSYEMINNSYYRKRLIHVFLIGLSFGFGYFFFGLYWINISFLHEFDKYFLLILPSLIIIPIILSLFYGLIAVFLYFFCPRNITSVFFSSIVFTSVEMIRSILTGFQWSQIGHALIPIEHIIQICSLFGELSLTTIGIILFTFPAMFMLERNNSYKKTSLLVFILIFVSIFTFSFYREGNYKNSSTDIEINILQPNITQKDKWDPDLLEMNINKLVDQSIEMAKTTSANNPGQRYFIWPETAIPVFVDENPSITHKITKYFKEDDYLMIGSMRREKTSMDAYEFFNSFFIINNENKIIGTYDKNQLVPFGEYLPLLKFFEKLKFIDLSALTGNFSRGFTGLTTLDYNIYIPDVLICYEAIFSNRLYEEINETNWLLNITNDAWFGRSTGPYQHFSMARLRAVERGKPLVRVANTGISGVINSYGEIISKSSLNVEFYDKEILPSKTLPTFYTKYNYYPLFFILLMSFIFICYVNKYNYKYTKQKDEENG